MSKTAWIIIVIIVIAVVGYLIFRSDGIGIPSTALYAVTASSQLAGDDVVIENARLTDAGYIVIHDDSAGTPGAIIGVSDAIVGEYENLVVSLNRASIEGETLYAMVHIDNGDGEFSAADDEPATEGDELVISSFAIEAAGEELAE